ncbi:hypothetical protein ACIROD_17755 [Peribacillus sp. NPDC101481]|uniref:hypothetical protein n=1 Tax=unclassified Peribacillus TaxID=2675266 RepID=UPI00382FFD39
MVSIVTQDFELFPHENGANIQEIEALLVNSDHILVRFIHLLVNLTHLLVNLNVTEDLELLTENGGNIREILLLLVNIQFWRISIDIKIINEKPPNGGCYSGVLLRH